MNPEVRTRQQFWGNFEKKEAEASGTNLMPSSEPVDRRPDKGVKTVPVKIAEQKERIIKGSHWEKGKLVTEEFRFPIRDAQKKEAMSVLEGYLLKGAEEAPPPEDTNLQSIKGEQPLQSPQTSINPRVDVSGKNPPKQTIEKKASRYALPGSERYPLDSYTDVQKAAVYFEKWANVFSPEHRREFCVNLLARANELSIPVSSDVEKYGSANYASTAEILAALDGRKNIIQNEEHIAVLHKLAEEQPRIRAEVFAEMLSQFDKVAGIDHLYDKDIPDPYYSTFGKTAEEDGAHLEGNDFVTDKQLNELAKRECKEMKQLFGEEFVKEFRKDPTSIFNSMPVDQKKVISRLATDSEYHV